MTMCINAVYVKKTKKKKNALSFEFLNEFEFQFCQIRLRMYTMYVCDECTRRMYAVCDVCRSIYEKSKIQCGNGVKIEKKNEKSR